ncbi:receptor-like protein kinase HSL1 [Arachis ipaensis]|uniref:receptor-like protein kinase HSL1 n=1 Tax=Arachis ipaensis TaxID=130454 RepID=UPI0007AF7C59|nr:receptor-like protein kinase HSL1 [Arachis ipaensis]
MPLLFFFFFFFVTPTLSLNQEGLLLLEAKNQLLPSSSSSLADWNPRDPTPCNWTCVTCNPNTSHVISLSLSSLSLSGPIPSSLCRLPSSLLHLDLSFNNFSASIPPSFSLFPNLRSLNLVENLLNGTIPSFLTNLTTLTFLHLSYNPFLPAPLPSEFGNMTNLQDLSLSGCNLLGPIPASLGKLSNLRNLELTYNSLQGAIPESLISGLTSIVFLELYENSLSGSLPRGAVWNNLTHLEGFDASGNDLTGTIPSELTRLKKLGSLNLFNNNLEGSLPESIVEAESLYELKLFNNSLNGSLPSQLGSNSPLQTLDLSYNNFSGEIPAGLCRRGAMQEIMLIYNSFSGRIPESLGDCRSLMRVRIRNNNISGTVPDAMWGLPHLFLLELDDNSLTGSISTSISGASNMSSLSLSFNMFSGSVPQEIGNLDNLVQFVASHNRLSGRIPTSVVKLSQLGKLVISDNELSGEIPLGISALEKLNDLDLSNNKLDGNIPSELGTLPVLNYLDLSGNLFSGRIPIELQNLNLNLLNLSNNQLSGEIPKEFDNENYKKSFLGNPGLCSSSSVSGLCQNLGEKKKNKIKYDWVFRFIFVLAGIVFVVGVTWFWFKFRSIKKIKKKVMPNMLKWRSFHKLGFSEYEVVKLLSEDNVIGSGASGKVYKVVLSNGEAVAVKKLWGPKNRTTVSEKDGFFEAEVETLGKIRHKNIVRLWCCCNSGDSKLLVYEYMPNGSLADLLHSSKRSLLDWPIRYRIAIDAAEGLSYLHHYCVPPIVHRDVKSHNILLDEDFGAKVADFGVARTFSRVTQGAESMSAIAGSYGYIAPEYAYTLRVNEKSDIYSFGVVILELVSGRAPLDPAYGDKDLVKWVSSTLEQSGEDQVIDPIMDVKYKGEIIKVLNIGLLCTNPLPINRPSMRKVVTMLHEISAIPRTTSGKLSPYYQEEASDNENHHGNTV